MTVGEVGEALALLAKYLGRPITDEAVARYTTALAGITREGLAAGLRRWMDAHAPGSFFPSALDLRTVVAEARRAEEAAARRGLPASLPEAAGAATGQGAPAVGRLVGLMAARLGGTMDADAYETALEDLARTVPGLRGVAARLRDDRDARRLARARRALTSPPPAAVEGVV